MEKIWLKQYPAGVPAEIDVDAVPLAGGAARGELPQVPRRCRPTGSWARRSRFGQVDELSRALAPPTCRRRAWQRGDRVAIMMPNVPQYPVAVAAILRAGLRGGQRQPAVHAARTRAPAEGLGRQGDRHPRELRRHAAAGDRQRCRPRRWCSPRWATCSACPRALIVNYVVRKVKKMVPAFDAARRRALQRRAGAGPRQDRTRRRRSGPTTSPCCSTPAAPPASARARCCCTATWSPTSCRPRPGTSRR